MTEFRRVPDPPPARPRTYRVDWAEVPALWWRDVHMYAKDAVELSVLDMFTAHAVHTMGRLTPPEFTEFTGLPSVVFAALGRRLSVLGLVAEDGAALVPGGSAAELTERTIDRQVETTADLLFLPDDEDLIAVTDWPDGCEPDVAAMTALPTHLHEAKVRELLAGRIDAGTIVGLPDTVVGLSDDVGHEELTAMAQAKPATKIPMCPVVRCTGIVRSAPHIDATLDIRGSRGRSVSIPLPGSAGLVQRWLRTARLILEPQHRAAVAAAIDPELDTTPVREDNDGLSLGLTGDQAARVAKTGPLTRDVGVQVKDKHEHVSVALRFVPLDQAARRLFDVDGLLDTVLARGKEATDVLAEQSDTVYSIGGVTVIQRRAWERGEYWLVRLLRESEDFAYD